MSWTQLLQFLLALVAVGVVGSVVFLGWFWHWLDRPYNDRERGGYE